MIQRSEPLQKHDRLAAFLRAYGLRAEYGGNGKDANLLIVDSEGAGAPSHLIYRPRSNPLIASGIVLAAAAIDFGDSLNPLVAPCRMNCASVWMLSRNCVGWPI